MNSKPDNERVAQLLDDLQKLQRNRFQPTAIDHRERFINLMTSVAELAQVESNSDLSLALKIVRVPGQKTNGLFGHILQMVEDIFPFVENEDQQKEDVLKALLSDRRLSLSEHANSLVFIMDNIKTPVSPYALGDFLVKKMANNTSPLPLGGVYVREASGALNATAAAFGRFLERTLCGYSDRDDKHQIKFLDAKIKTWAGQNPMLGTYILSLVSSDGDAVCRHSDKLELRK